MRYVRVPIRSDRLKTLWSVWTLGAAVLWRVVLLVMLVGAGAYVLIGAAALLLGFDPLPWFTVSALIWAPSAAGYALGGNARRMKLNRARAGRPPDLELVAGWSVGGLAMSHRPSWLNTAAVFMLIGGVLAIDLAPPVLAMEFVDWLMAGEWPGITLAEHLALPFSVVLLVVGLLLSVEGLDLGERSLTANARWFSIN